METPFPALVGKDVCHAAGSSRVALGGDSRALKEAGCFRARGSTEHFSSVVPPPLLGRSGKKGEKVERDNERRHD